MDKIAQGLGEGEVLRAIDALLCTFLLPLPNDAASVHDVKGAQVGHCPGRQQDISADVEEARAEIRRHVGPTVSLAPEPVNELLRPVQLLGAQLNVVLQVLLLFRHGSKFIVQGLQFVSNLLQLRPLLVQFVHLGTK